MREIQIGEVLDGRYEILALIGSGGMGRVYRARQVRLDRTVALKVPSAAVMSDEAFLRRFEREARTVARFNHEHIVSIYDVVVEPDLAYISMEFVDGLPLDKFIAQQYWDLTVGDLLAVVRQTCEGVHAAHLQGVIHRDIKPANIFVTREGHRIKIMDFGIARVGDATALTVTGSVMGTPHYMSPEQIRGLALGPASDIYALAVMFYLLLTMTPVFEGETTTLIYKHIHEPPPPAREKNTRLPPEADEVLQRGLAKDPAARFAQATDLAAALEHALAGWRDRPYHQLVELTREQMIRLGIPTTPPPRPGVELGATVIAGATQLAAAMPAAPPPPPRTGSHPAAAKTLHTASAITKTAAVKVAAPTAKLAARGLAKLLAAPFRLLRALPPKPRATVVGLAVIAGGALLYFNMGLSAEQRTALRQAAQRRAQQVQSALPGRPRHGRTAPGDVNQVPQVNWNGPPPPSEVRAIAARALQFSVIGRDPDGRIDHYVMTLDDRPPVRVPAPESGALRWAPPPPPLEPDSTHVVTIVAVDDQGGVSAPLRHGFRVGL